METLKKLRRLAKPNEWCFTFDLQDGYHHVGIDPAFQEYMQFDVRGELFQCGALPFGWNDSPRIFVKVMRVLVECLRSPASAADRREVRKLREGSFVRQRWAARRRAGGCGRKEHQQGARVLPYMDDFLVLASSRIEALRARELVSRVLARLGIGRNEKKGHWEPTQLVEHLGLEVDLKAGQFRVTSARLQKIHQQARALLSEATRQRQWLPARRLAAFAGLCQSVYLAVPPARLYLQEIHFVISTKRGWGAKDLEEPNQGKAAHGLLPLCLGRGQMWFQQLEALADEVVILPRSRDRSIPAGADGLTHVVYDDGDKEDLDMSKEKFEVVPAAVQQASTWDAALQERWRGELGDSSLTELAVQMQGAALGGATVGNYRPKAQAFMQFCQGQQRQWLPATEATVRLYIAHLLSRGTVKAASLQPYLSAINNYHEDMGYPGPAKGRSVTRAVKGMSALQVQAEEQAGVDHTVRTWLPARHVSTVHAHALQLQPVGRPSSEFLRACTYLVFAFVTFGRPDTGVAMLRRHISIADGVVSVVLHKEKGRRHVRLKRRLTIPAAGVPGLVQLLQHWERVRDALWAQSPQGSKERSSYWRLPWERGKLLSAHANGWVQLAETKWPVVVIYKDGHTVEKLDLKMSIHIRLGHISDGSMQNMIDEKVSLGVSEAQYTRNLVRHSASGYRWFVLFVDDSTTWVCVYFLKQKSDYLDSLKMFLVEGKKHRSRMGLNEKYHMVLHPDGDSTMIYGQTAIYCKDQGIEQRHGSPYLHENQAWVERSHRTVQAMARALLLTSGFGVDMWPLAVRHSVYILNRTFQKSLHNRSPYYLLYEKHHDLSHLRVFGCLAYAFVDPDRMEHKLSNRAKQLTYVGHSEVSSAYLLYDPESRKVVNSGMVKLNEALDKLGKVVTAWDPSAVASLRTNFMVTALDGDNCDPPLEELGNTVMEMGVYLPEDSDEILAVLKVQAKDGECWASLRAYLDGHPERLSAVRASVSSSELNVHYPLFTEVRVDTEREELEAGMICARAVGASSRPYCIVLLTNFTFIDLPAGKVHFSPEHTCLAAMGGKSTDDMPYMLPDGVSEPKGAKQAMEAPDAAEWGEAIQQELEAPVEVKGALHMMDVEDVPPGVRLLDMPLVLKVKLDKHRQLQKRKARGLEYEGKTCARLLKAYSEPCLYYIEDSGLTVLILAYVDDYLIATDDKAWYDSFVTAFHLNCACKDLGVLDLVMGIGVRGGAGVAYLSQSGYIAQMVETYGLQDAKPAALPMALGCSLEPTDGKDATIPFRALLGQL
ncbi:hypothetical protein CYMTET_4563 [Cymbomonas tetramitiformis]|uniref:Uncharacterized protein n=1 Tax=Cymbomonas tetramitiformis TaxID=36881 RepID=A0AAE0H194_9CHLO|nr:hypothetical protein CYMTET_4563 [Cymbomonas tetramitiformis]